MKIDGKFVSVYVRESACRNYACFYPHRWTHQSHNNNYVQIDNYYSCGTRNYHGCPIAPQKKRCRFLVVLLNPQKIKTFYPNRISRKPDKYY
jgi:hypothetical protein